MKTLVENEKACPGEESHHGDQTVARVNAHFEQQAEYWERLYSSDSVFGEIHKYRLSAILSLVRQLALSAGSPVLEIGCGAGFLATSLAKLGYLVNAVDPAEKMVRLTCGRAQRAGLGQNVLGSRGNVSQLAFPDRRFSLVSAIGVLPWLPFPIEALQEMARVVVDRGWLIFTMDNVWRLNQTLDPLVSPLFQPLRKAGRSLFERPSLRTAKRVLKQTAQQLKPARDTEEIVAHFHSIREVDRIIAQCGLKKVSCMTLGFGPFSFWGHEVLSNRAGIRLHRLLQRLSEKRWPGVRSTGSQFLILARKQPSSNTFSCR